MGPAQDGGAGTAEEVAVLEARNDVRLCAGRSAAQRRSAPGNAPLPHPPGHFAHFSAKRPFLAGSSVRVNLRGPLFGGPAS